MNYFSIFDEVQSTTGPVFIDSMADFSVFDATFYDAGVF